jgi:uncharacterized protein YceH (UPF0502 family)
MHRMRDLEPLEARVVAVLVEKERTVPDAYPLSLNALVAGCNQKTSRNPVMNASEAEVVAAIESLKRLSLVIESSGGRVMRYAQNIKRVLQVPSESVALLATLMLRGPQTPAELRANSERLCRFSDISAVEGFLAELAQRSAGALVQEVPRQPGSRENRWGHCLCGAIELPPAALVGPSSNLQVDLPAVVAEVEALTRAYAQARADGDSQSLERLRWQSPRALLGEGGEQRDARGHVAVLDRAGGAQAVQVRTFGRDFAVASIRWQPRADGSVRCESTTWVRFAQGWRLVAAQAGDDARRA